MHAVEARLAGIYIQSRVELLNDVLEEYFEDDGTVWSEAPLPTGPRDCAFEIINALVRAFRYHFEACPFQLGILTSKHARRIAVCRCQCRRKCTPMH